MQRKVGKFLAWLTSRKDDVRRRRRTILQSKAEALFRDYRSDFQRYANIHPTLALA